MPQLYELDNIEHCLKTADQNEIIVVAGSIYPSQGSMHSNKGNANQTVTKKYLKKIRDKGLSLL